MLDINLIREQPDLVRKALRDRQMDPSPVDAILELDERRRGMLTEVESSQGRAQCGLQGDQPDERCGLPPGQNRGDARSG